MHPDHQELQGLVFGTLDEPSADQIADHIERCPECEETIRLLEAKSDTYIEELRRPVDAEPFTQESDCARAVSFIERIGREPTVGAQQAITAADVREELARIGQYQLLAKLGEGGMGAVYKARHTKLNKLVALKVLSADRLADENAVARFKREMLAVGQLDHPNIVAAHDAGEADDRHYLVMELVDGIDLSTLVRSCGMLPVAEACEIICQAASGLEHAHSFSMVHRDIKPGNLMLTFGGRVKVLDMGLALLDEMRTSGTAELTNTGQMMGTLNYMAPEQGTDSHQVDIRADIYSLGATLFKLLTGQALYDGPKYDTPLAKMMALAVETPRALAEVRQDVPPELSDLVARMLSKDQDERPASPQELVGLLTPFAEGAQLEEVARVAKEKVETEPDAPSGNTFAHLQSSFTDTEPTMLKAPEVKAAVRKSPLPKTRQSRWSVGRRTAVALSVAALGGIVLLAVIFSLRTGQGTIVVEVPEGEEDNIEISVRQGGKVVEVFDADKGWTVEIKEGKYELDIKKGGDRFAIGNKTLTVTRDKKMVVKIHSQSDLANGKSEKTSPLPSDQQLAPTFSVKDGTYVRFMNRKSDKCMSVGDASKKEGASVRQHNFTEMALEQIWQLKSAGDGYYWLRNRNSNLYLRGTSIKAGEKLVQWPLEKARDDFKWKFENISQDYVKIINKQTGFCISVWGGETRHDQYLVQWKYQDTSTDHHWKIQPALESADILSAGKVREAVFVPVKHDLLASYGHDDQVRYALFSPDANSIVSSCNRNSVKLYDVKSQKLRHTLKPRAESSFRARFSPDSRLLVLVGSDGRLELYDVKSGEIVHQLSVGMESHFHIAFQPDGKELAMVNSKGIVTLWDLETGRSQPSPVENCRPGGPLAFSPNGKMLAVANQAGKLVLWDIAKKTMAQRFEKITGLNNVRSVTFSQDGRTVRCTADKFFVLDVATGNELRAINRGTISRNGTFLTNPGNQHLRVVNMTTGKEGSFQASHVKIHSVAISPDGRTIASGDHRGNVVLWDSTTHRRIGGPSGHRGWVNTLSFSEDGSLLVSASWDGTVRVWSIKRAGQTRGLITQFFQGQEFDKLLKTRVDSQIKFDWGYEAPVSGVPADGFSASFSGWLEVPESGFYKLILKHDESSRLTLDGELVLDGWNKGGRTEATLELAQGPHPFMLEYVDKKREANLSLQWLRPGNREPELIPPSAFSYDPASLKDLVTPLTDSNEAVPAGLPADPVVFMTFEPKMVFEHGGKKLVRDRSGNGLHAHLSGFHELIDTPVGKRIAFDGRGYAMLPNHPRLRGGADLTLTVAYWFHKKTGAAVRKFSSPNHKDWSLTATKEHLEFYGEEGNNDVVMKVPLPEMKSNWNHAAMVLDARKGQIRFFLNGKLQLEKLLPPKASSGTDASVGIGIVQVWPNKFGDPHPCRLDELAIYDRVLSKDEVLAVYKHGAARFAAATAQPKKPRPTSPKVEKVPAAIKPSSSPGHGLLGEYYEGMEFEKLLLARIDPKIDFSWKHSGVGAEPAKGVPRDLFSVRWTGSLVVPEDGKYQLQLTTDDGGRMWLDGKQIVDHWQHEGQASSKEAEVTLTQGTHAIRIDFQDKYSMAIARLSWRRPGKEKWSIVPSENLRPPKPKAIDAPDKKPAKRDS